MLYMLYNIYIKFSCNTSLKNSVVQPKHIKIFVSLTSKNLEENKINKIFPFNCISWKSIDQECKNLY